MDNLIEVFTWLPLPYWLLIGATIVLIVGALWAFVSMGEWREE
jgi:hypothetical protein